MESRKNSNINHSCFFVGPSLAHEMRYPGGDCTSDIWTEIYDDSIAGVKQSLLPAKY